MNNNSLKIVATQMERWFNEREIREQILLFILGFVIIYVLFNAVFIKPVVNQQKQLEIQLENINKETDIFKQHSATVLTAVNENAFRQQLLKQSQLKTQSKLLDKKFIKIVPTIVLGKNFSQIMKDILSEERGITLLDLKMLPVKPWLAGHLSDIDLPDEYKKLYKYGMQIEFHSNYINTFNYLKKLEKLPWHIYWETIEYRVTQYPEADVVLKLYILSHSQDVKLSQDMHDYMRSRLQNAVLG